MSSNNNSGGGIGLLGVVGIVFVILKFTEVIDWSWWWVLSPFYPALFVLAVAGLAAAIGGGLILAKPNTN